MHKSGGTKRRGRTKAIEYDPSIATKGPVKLQKRTEASRPTGTGGGKNRGDRRDTNPTFTGNNRPKGAKQYNPAGRSGERRST